MASPLISKDEGPMLGEPKLGERLDGGSVEGELSIDRSGVELSTCTLTCKVERRGQRKGRELAW